ncbi:ATP-dependent DNA helicase RecG [Candidatus Beckwithbacteria bacterium]|nr:ATP-dependent DNA helicase RecG [Candidatus Beckwithbacteria bacterium]
MKLTLETPIEDLYMVGEKYADVLKKQLNIHTVEDLLYHFPFRYDDLTAQKTIAEIEVGETVTLQGQIVSLKNAYTRNGKNIQQGVFTDGTNTVQVTWFNQPYLTKTLAPGTQINLAGKVTMFGRRVGLTAPKFEILRTLTPANSQVETTHTGRLVPIYPETFGVSSKWLRSRLKPIIKYLDGLVLDWLPTEVIHSQNVLSLAQALIKIHFPDSQEDIKKARERLAFDELFLLQLQVQQRKGDWQQKSLRRQFNFSQNDLEPFIKKLPFALTTDQKQGLTDIIKDLNSSVPMNRLLEGDVGSGKTVVAAAAIYLIHQAGSKVAFMAPTEVLANQHLETLSKFLKPHKIKIGFFTGSKKAKGNLQDYDVYLGTHALLFQDLPHEHIGLVIIDEQHRFGVAQRSKLIGKKKLPHVLTMTATPIPRTVALTLYGDLSLSMIKHAPHGRKQVKTWVVPGKKRLAAYEWIQQQIKENKTQAFFIYPLIDQSESLLMSEVKAAKIEFEKLNKQLPNLKIGLLHGRMKPKEKEEVMGNFAGKKLDILVATSVIEVGIDIANATIMVIDGAERFGLAQLHQLRGRVGRSDKQSYCLLFSTSDGDQNKRLKAMEHNHSGIALAELDLKMRGPGQLYGTMQSGFMALKIASLDDQVLISQTYQLASKLLPKLQDYPLLQEKLKQYTIQNVQPN